MDTLIGTKFVNCLFDLTGLLVWSASIIIIVIQVVGDDHKSGIHVNEIVEFIHQFLALSIIVTTHYFTFSTIVLLCEYNDVHALKHFKGQSLAVIKLTL